MSENTSNTPIFDRFMAEQSKSYEELVQFVVPKETDFKWGGCKPAGVFLDEFTAEGDDQETEEFSVPASWIAKPVKNILPQLVSMQEDVDADEMEVKYGSFQAYMRHLVDEFIKKYPGVSSIAMHTQENFDLTVKAKVTGYIPGVLPKKGVDFEKERLDYFVDSPSDPDMVYRKSGGETFVVRGLAETLPPVIRTEPLFPKGMSARDALAGMDKLSAALVKPLYPPTPEPFIQIEPKTEPIPLHTVMEQSDLYRSLMTHVAGPPVQVYENDSNTGTQTDKSVNAAPSDEFDSEIADEE